MLIAMHKKVGRLLALDLVHSSISTQVWTRVISGDQIHTGQKELSVVSRQRDGTHYNTSSVCAFVAGKDQQ